LRRANQFGDLVKILVAIAKYTSSFGLFAKIPLLEGEEVFGLTKHKVDLSFGLEVDSHWHDRMNFSHSKTANAMTLINQLSVVDVGEGSNADPIVTHNGVEVLECLCGDGIW
jgi:hypothetical protein